MQPSPYKEITRVFLRLGFLGFGGPIATIAMMEEEAVRKGQWVTPARFAEIYALCKVLPGPAATQVALALGRERAGNWGGALAGTLFMLPSFFIVLAFAVVYGQWHPPGSAHTPSPFFASMQAAALSVIVISTLQMARNLPGKLRPWLIGFASAAGVLLRPSFEPLFIFGFGILGIFLLSQTYLALKSKLSSNKEIFHAVLFIFPFSSPFWQTPLAKLFWVCFKAGAFVFGTGLAIVPLLEGEVVGHYHWLRHSEFMDALAIGQITPGPVVITVTFIGYRVAGVLGATLATIGIFLAPFINILWLIPLFWKRISKNGAPAHFAAYAMPAVVGSIFATSGRLGMMTLTTPMACLIFLGVLLANYKFKIAAWKLIPFSGLLGVALHFLFGLN